MEQLTQKNPSGLCRFIGELLLEARLVTPAQLKEAIEIQNQTGDLLGQILVRQGFVTQDALVERLEHQIHQRLESQTITHRQIGEVLLSLHAISRWQLSRALDIQNQIPKKIGQLLVDLGYTTRGKVEQALSNQAIGKCKPAQTAPRRSLGELLLQADRVTPEQLERALVVQRQTHAYLGDILVQQGAITEAELEDILATQLWLAGSDDPDELQPIYKKLGEILVETRQLTPVQLNEAIEEQSRSLGRKLGDILIEKGLVPLKELMRALRLQERLATLTMATATGLTLLTSCGTPQVPTQQPLSFVIAQQQQMQQMNPNGVYSVRQGPFKALQVDSGAKLLIYQNGSRLIEDVPFYRQGNDNTCGQAVMTSLLNYWGIKYDYQGVVNEANPRNAPTTDEGIVAYLRSKGLQAQTFRKATIDNLIAQVNKGRPTAVLLDFGGLSQEHYVIVVGYNPTKNTIIVHDSLENPYVEMPATTFTTMWENKAVRSVHVFGGDNYQRMMVDAFK